MKSDNLKLQKSINSLIQASAYLNDIIGENIDEAKSCINQAVKKIQKQNKKINTRKQNQTENEKWWTNIVSGTAKLAESDFTKESHTKSLKQLQSMIDIEQKTLDNLDNLENKTNTQTTNNDLLNG